MPKEEEEDAEVMANIEWRGWQAPPRVFTREGCGGGGEDEVSNLEEVVNGTEGIPDKDTLIWFVRRPHPTFVKF